ncbi:MAG: hypothetical protein QNJ92_02465 [Alphaproteobacteria bacterium]|nr:hypothetical protein [Alphaproteobacteria bacterium]
MLKRLPLRDRTLALAFLVAASLYGVKAIYQTTHADMLMVDKAPIAWNGSYYDCRHAGAPSETHPDTDQLG